MADELARYRKALRPLEAAARKQPWAKERPWRAKSHVAIEGGVVVVDLHDLKAALAKKAVHAVVQAGDPEAGAVLFVVGQGRHSLGKGVLGEVVTSTLGRLCVGSKAIVRFVGPARVAWITDRARAPASITGGGSGLKWLILLIISAFLTAVARALGWIGR